MVAGNITPTYFNPNKCITHKAYFMVVSKEMLLFKQLVQMSNFSYPMVYYFSVQGRASVHGAMGI